MQDFLSFKVGKAQGKVQSQDQSESSCIPALPTCCSHKPAAKGVILALPQCSISPPACGWMNGWMVGSISIPHFQPWWSQLAPEQALQLATVSACPSPLSA